MVMLVFWGLGFCFVDCGVSSSSKVKGRGYIEVESIKTRGIGVLYCHVDGCSGLSLTASLISSLCSSVSRFSGFASCAGPWDCALVAGAGADCCICLLDSGLWNSPWAAFPRARCRENDEALKGMAFVLTERSGSFVPA